MGQRLIQPHLDFVYGWYGVVVLVLWVVVVAHAEVEWGGVIKLVRYGQ